GVEGSSYGTPLERRQHRFLAEANPDEAPPTCLPIAPPLETTVSQPLRQPLQGASIFTTVPTPLLPTPIQVLCERPRLRRQLAVIAKPAADHVLILEVLVGGRADQLRRRQPLRLPCQCPVYHPCQDRGSLCSEFLGEVGIRFLRLNREWNELQPPPHRLIYRVERRLSIADEEQLELRLEGEEIVEQEARCDGIATRETLQPLLVPAATFARLACGHEPRPVQHRNFRWMTVVSARHEGAHGSGGRVVAKDVIERVEADALPIAPRPVDEDDGV